MFNHKADESVTCDECCYYKQNHYYCMFVLFHILLFEKNIKWAIRFTNNTNTFSQEIAFENFINRKIPITTASKTE